METLTIGEVARRAGVGVETIRFYDREGLIAEPRRRPSGYRQYSAEAVRRVRFIRHAKELGFTLKEISELLSLRVDHGAHAVPDLERGALGSDSHLRAGVGDWRRHRQEHPLLPCWPRYIGDRHLREDAVTGSRQSQATGRRCLVAPRRCPSPFVPRCVLRPGGRLLLLEHVLSEKPLLRALMRRLDAIPLHIWGAHIDRGTVLNVDRAGFKEVQAQDLSLDIVKAIAARAPR